MTTVEGTNDFSIVSKLSAAEAGYFHDEYLSQFVERQKRRAALVNWGYYLRYKSLEATFEKFVKHFCQNKEDPFQILSVGAGFDTTFFNVSKLGDNFKFYEVDLPSNVKRKTCLIQNSEKCCKELKNPKFSPEGIISENFQLFACDLANQIEFKRKLSHLGFNFHQPTIILSECVITYMDELDSTNLINFLGSNLNNAAFFVYEQIRPYDGFGQFMVAHFLKVGSPIKGVLKYPGVKEQCERYLSSGWGSCSALTLTDVFYSLTPVERQRVLDIEPFDEFEEMLMKSSHYMVACAANGSCSDLLDSLLKTTTFLNISNVKKLNLKVVEIEPVARFGHGVASHQDVVYSVGGFGVDSGNQKRLPQLLRIDLSLAEPSFTSTTAPVFGRMYPGLAVDKDRGRVLVTGGRHSPHVGLGDVLEIDCGSGDFKVLSLRLPMVRWRHFSVVLGEYLVLVGGCGESGTQGDVLALNLGNGNWCQSVELGFKVHSGAGVVWGDRVIYSGGWGDGKVLGDLWSIGVKDGKIDVRQLDVKILPRFSHTAHVIGDHLLVVGGVGLGDIPPVEVFNLVTGEVVSYELPVNVGDELLMVHNHGSVVVGGHLYLVGGGGNCFSFGTHYNKTFKIDLNHLIS